MVTWLEAANQNAEIKIEARDIFYRMELVLWNLAWHRSSFKPSLGSQLKSKHKKQLVTLFLYQNLDSREKKLFES